MHMPVRRHQEMGFWPIVAAVAQSAASGYAAKTAGKAQSSVLKAQAALDTVRARSEEIAGRNRMLIIGVGGAVALGGLALILMRKK